MTLFLGQLVGNHSEIKNKYEELSLYVLLYDKAQFHADIITTLSLYLHSMNIAILSRGEQLYSTQSLMKAGEARRHGMEVLDPYYFSSSIENNSIVLRYHDEIVDDIDAIIPRVGASNTFFGASLVRQFESANVFCTVSANAILQSRDKWQSFQIMAKAGVPVPNTVLGTPFDPEQNLRLFQNEKVILKVLEGTHGNGVILTESYQNALSTIEALHTSKTKFILQEYIEESEGTDLRVIVVDGVAVAAMKRSCKSGDFRSNLHRGGTATTVELTREEERVAIKAAKALQLGICGVDILQSNRGPLVLEVNSTPGLEGIEKTTGKNVASRIISFVERNKR